MILLLHGAVIVLVSGPVAHQISDVIGADDTAVPIWAIGEVADLSWASPNAKQGGARR